MRNYLRVLAVYCPILLLMVDTLEAQQKNKLLVDATTQLISRSQLRVSDGVPSMLEFGTHQPFADFVCASPLNNHLGTGASLELMPHIHLSREFTLHVVVSQDVKPGCLAAPMIAPRRNEFDVRLHDGEVAMLGGLKPLYNGDGSSQLVFVLIPTANPAR